MDELPNLSSQYVVGLLLGDAVGDITIGVAVTAAVGWLVIPLFGGGSMSQRATNSRLTSKHTTESDSAVTFTVFAPHF